MNAIQRIEAYKFALEKISDDDWLINNRPYVCLVIYDYAKSEQWLANYECNIQDIKKDFPEFAAQMPDRIDPAGAWWLPTKIDIRKTAIRNSIDLAYYNLLVEAVNAFGLPSLPIPMNDTAKVLHHMITCNGVTCKDTVKSGYRARIANIIHDHGMKDMIGKEILYDTNEYGNGYYYKRHYVKPEHVGAAVECYMRINVPRARKSKVLEALNIQAVV